MMKTPNITIRPITTEDVQYTLTVENDPEVWAYSDNTNAPYTIEEITQFCTEIAKSKDEMRYIIEADNQRAGFIDLYDINKKSAHIGIIIYPKELRSANIGHRAMKLVEEICKNEFKLEEIIAQVSPCNEQSVHFFEKCNFTKTINTEGYILKKVL